MRFLLRAFRIHGIPAAVTATTGTVALEFDSGQTLHSLLKIPVPGDSENTSEILSGVGVGSERAEYIASLRFLVIDEITMFEGSAVSGVHDILQEVRCSQKPFAGLTILFTGDPHQLPPVIPSASPESTVRSSFFNSPKFKNSVLVLPTLTQNVRQGRDEKYGQIWDSVATGSLPAGISNEAPRKITKSIREVNDVIRTTGNIPGVPYTSSVSESRAFVAPPRPEEDPIGGPYWSSNL